MLRYKEHENPKNGKHEHFHKNNNYNFMKMDST